MPTPALHISDDERRARIAVRHALAPAARLSSPEEITEALTVLHATEPATVYLSCWARSDSVTVADIDRALYVERSLVKQLAMRRTLFVFPRELLPAAWGSASNRVADTERARIAKDILLAELAAEGDTDGHGWLETGRADVLAALAGQPDGLTATELRRAAPSIDVKVSVSPGSAWSASRVLTHLGLTAELVRGQNTGHWRTSRPRWVLTQDWLGPVEAAWSSADGYRELTRRWLQSFGPGTENDIVWWLGSTKTVVRTALAELGAVAVSLDDGSTGWVLPGDEAVTPDPGPWVALLPVLDPTVMGWKNRDFYLGPHGDALFDRSGNAGSTAWVNGRAVGAWIQDEDGVVELRLLEKVSAASRRALEVEAARLTTWLVGVRVVAVYQSPAMGRPRPVGK